MVHDPDSRSIEDKKRENKAPTEPLEQKNEDILYSSPHALAAGLVKVEVYPY